MKHVLLTIGAFFSSILLIQSQTLYGTTFYGGNNKGGTINQFIVGTNNLNIIKHLDTFARSPKFTNLIQGKDGILYGMTSQGGIFNAGVIFSHDPISSTFLRLKDFDIINGGFPYGSLIQAKDGNLYGMTTSGGNQDLGVIFSFDLVSSTYKKLIDFDSANGATPYGSLLQATDGKLYGMTALGGINNRGVLFSYDITSATYTKLNDFDDVNGSHPYGSLIQAVDGKFYGMTSTGGSANYGAIFTFDPVTSFYQKFYDFDGVNGANPIGDFMQDSNGILYGMTGSSGNVGPGVIFSFDPNSTVYLKLADLDGANVSPSGALLDGGDGKLYGVTYVGGYSFRQTGSIFSFEPSSLTVSTVYSFDYPDGGNPSGSLLKALDGKFYGLTTTNGSNYNAEDAGVIFSFDPITSVYTALKSVNCNQDGSNISAGLIRAKNGRLYGVTTSGGSSSAGVIFSYDPQTSTYSTLKDLDWRGGSHPYGGLMQASDGKFYGMTAFGGISTDFEFFDRWGDLGVIFSFDPSSSTYTNIVDLTTNGGYLGGHPYGALVQADDGKLYGMTSTNGGGYRASGSGIIFSFDPSLFVPSKLKDFANFDPGDNFLDNLNGGNPYGSFLKGSDGKLYGMTSGGGNNNDGVIFSYEPGSDTYTKLVDLDDANGSHPYGTLIQARDGNLYGMTYDGGSNNAGVIFSFDLLTSTYTKLIDLNFNDGSNPYGSLIQASDGKFYGMTSGGGDNDLGVIFSFDPITSSYTRLIDYDGSNGSTPYIGSAFIELAALSPLPVTLISFSGQNNGNINELSWKNAGEYSLSYYQVERSVDGRSFNYIFRVKAIGAFNYSYDDNIARVQSGVYFYRLKMVDLDGNFTYSNVISITGKNDLLVFVNPNPFKNTLKVILNSANSDNAILALTDLSGRQLFKTSRPIFPGDNTIEITKVGTLPNGTYILTVVTSNKTQIFKIVKSD